MTIRRGAQWGAGCPLPDGAPIAATNAELRRLVTCQMRGDAPTVPVGVVGGDLWRVVGAPPGGVERLRGARARTAPIDLIEVAIEGHLRWACVGVVARRSWWRGPVVAAANVDRLGEWRIAPAAHPNDGRMHVVSTGIDQRPLSVTQRVLARRRLRSGAHVPHPAISVQRVRRAEFRFDRSLAVWLDGERVGECRTLTVSVRPGAAAIAY
ncbi:diacylglycerol/lipid kinase family protein [Candidatus Poriferisodalis sp.]|uniref:diacylglycerol/lipid kinase family protein n=1 Tax=Candidatus Poriferisodalis sp. TaxID=3101277 RepID=UPI003B01F74E